MSRRRQHRRTEKTRRHEDSRPAAEAQLRTVVRQADYVERLAYTRSQAAQALGLSRSSFIRRVLPFVETLEMPWGAKLIPVDELERLLAERRRDAAKQRLPPAAKGRRPAVPAAVVERIRTARAEGAAFRVIADDLTAEGVPTVHGGARWWPSTVRAILERSEREGGCRTRAFPGTPVASSRNPARASQSAQARRTGGDSTSSSKGSRSESPAT